MRLLYLINPLNPLVSITQVDENSWNQFRVWKPLGLMIVAALTPDDWEIRIFDENLSKPDYQSLATPDLVGITAFTSQAPRAYEVATEFRDRGVPVVLGGVHVSTCLEEALRYGDAVVTGEAESAWPTVVNDAVRGALKRVYHGEFVPMEDVPAARHDLLPKGYRFGSIQTTRGCPLSCSFCSVTVFNGSRYRHRPAEEVVNELRAINEKLVLFVDDNLIGTRKDHIERSKELFRAIIKADLGKKWIGQTTINMADDDELLELAAEAGCSGVLIGFESTTLEGLAEVHKKFNVQKGRDFRASIRRMQSHGITVIGSFIMGLDVDKPGIGKQIADAATAYGVDLINVLFLTPLPGTELWKQMDREGRIAAKNFPEDWKNYTLIHPVATHNHLSWDELIDEVLTCFYEFYSFRRIAKRALGGLWNARATWRRRLPGGVLAATIANLSYRFNIRIDKKNYQALDTSRGESYQQKLARGETSPPDSTADSSWQPLVQLRVEAKASRSARSF